MTTLAVINSAVERLSYLIEGASGEEEVLNELEQVKSDLEQAAKALSAANNNLGTEVNRLLRELSHDIEDLAELFIAQQASEALSSASIWSDFSRCFFSSYEKGLAEDVQVFSRRARALVDSFGDKGLLSSKGGDNHSRPTAELQLIDPRHIREPGPIALEGYVENLMEALVGGGEGLSVIPICGIGGIGKTTLARKVYNHTLVREHFDCLAWSMVTQDYQSRHILSSVLTTISWANHSKIAAMDTMELFVMLHKHLSGRRYLIVLDDVWSTAAWDSLRFVFPDGCNGSRIVITTRSVEVAHYTSTSPPIQMKMLTDEQSWELFQIKSGLQDYPGKSNPRIEEIRKKIVRSCQGLPLAISILGQSLSREGLRDWELILREIHSVDNKVSHVLDLSYDNLPSHLQPCFLYFGCFPSDRPVMVDKLLLLWMSEGLISKRMEVAENYFSELVDRNLVIVEKEDLLTSRRFTSCHVHDLIRDLCISRGEQEEFFRVIDSSHANKISSSTCRLAVYMNKFEDMKNTTLGIPRVNRIRSILFFDTVEPKPKSTWPSEVTDLTNGQGIRVLYFEGVDFQVKKLPRGIENLRHLTHMSLQGCNLKELPSSFGNFPFLETLNLHVMESCVMTIPNVLRKLSRLRHLYFPLAFRCVGNDKIQLDRLKNLEVLENFHAGSCDARDLLELENLRFLKVTVDGNNLDLSNFINSIKKMKFICHSSLVVKRFDCYSKERLSMVKELVKCSVLHALDLEGYLGAFSHDTVFGLNFSEMVFRGSEFKENPKILGKLPNLKHLELCNDAFLGPNLVCYETHFPKLTSLKLATLQSLKEWEVESGAMPVLTILTIEQCDKLEMLPSGLVEIPTLRKLMIGSMPKLFQHRVKEIIEEEMSNGNEEIFSATFYDCDPLGSNQVRDHESCPWDCTPVVNCEK